MKQPGRLSSLSIMFPFLNDWGTVGSLVALAIETAKQYTEDWEVVIVDDGSRPQDRKALEMIIEALCQKNIRIIHHDQNRGYGGALRSGFSHCRKEWIFYTDCDAQYDPRELADLIQAIRPAVSMVNGYKIKRHDPWYRTVMGRLYHHTVRIAFRLPIRDTDCDFRLIRRSVFERVKLYENTGTICVELVKKIDQAGFSIAEVPVHHFWRTSGKSQFFNLSRLLRTAENLGTVWWKLMVKKHYT